MNDKPDLDPSDAKAVKGFDLAAWITGAKLPQRSTVVYQRPDLYSTLDELEREIRLEGGEQEEASVAQTSKLGKLHKQYTKVSEEIAASALKVVVRAATDDAITQARRDVKKEDARAAARTEWDEDGHADEAEDNAQMQAEIAGVDAAEVDAYVRARVAEAKRAFVVSRTQVAFSEHLLTRLLVEPKSSSVEQTREFLRSIGPDQASKLFELIGQVTQDRQVPSAPFSQPSSRASSGGTSSRR